MSPQVGLAVPQTWCEVTFLLATKVTSHQVCGTVVQQVLWYIYIEMQQDIDIPQTFCEILENERYSQLYSKVILLHLDIDVPQNLLHHSCTTACCSSIQMYHRLFMRFSKMRVIVNCIARWLCNKVYTVSSLGTCAYPLRSRVKKRNSTNFFAEYSLFYRALLQKRSIIWSILLTVATPYPLRSRVTLHELSGNSQNSSRCSI